MSFRRKDHVDDSISSRYGTLFGVSDFSAVACAVSVKQLGEGMPEVTSLGFSPQAAWEALLAWLLRTSLYFGTHDPLQVSCGAREIALSFMSMNL